MTNAMQGVLGAMCLAALVVGCSGGDDAGGTGGSGAFTAATPPADVCTILTLGDVQTILPNAVAGVEEPTPDTSDQGLWSRICKYETAAASAQSIELVVYGAITPQGLQGLKVFVGAIGSSSTPVSGLGEMAQYWEQDTMDNGLVALQGSHAVDVTAYFIQPFPTEAQFRPLVEKGLAAVAK